MAAAARQALAEAGLAMHEIDFFLADLAGEQYAFKELVLAQQRLMRQRREELPLWHPAQSLGDTGAAAGTVGLAVLREAFVKGYAVGPRVMLTTASAGGARAAAVVERG
jgi:3-oxoacyl-[acyl-carrier-protein] synthase-1